MTDRTHKSAAEAFLDHYRIVPRSRDQDLLWEVGEAFAQLPYENLTKLIKKHRADPAHRRRLPGEVAADHLKLGTGGTCFSLTHFFVTILGRLGYDCRPVMCDMRVGPDTHCAVIIRLNDGEFLMDPGYLLHRPILLQPGETLRDTGVAEVRVKSEPGSDAYEVHTFDTWRYRLKLAAVGPERFVALWEDSFDWTMMNGVHLSRGTGDGYAYLHGHKLRLQGRSTRENLNIRGRQAEVLEERFGIDGGVVRQAYDLVDRLRKGTHE